MSTTLAISTQEILEQLATVMAIDRVTLANWDATTEQDVRNVIRNGLRRFYHPPPIEGNIHQWSFLQKQLEIVAQPVYETGTVTIVDGVVTLAAGTFPTWAADAFMKVDGINAFVNTRDSGTQVTLFNTALDVDAGTSYELHRYREALPTDFGDFLGSILYNHASYPRALRLTTDHEIRTRYATNERTGQVCAVAITPVEFPTGASLGTARGYLSWWPTMDTESIISARYRAVPQDNLDDTDIRTGASTVVQVDAVHAQTVLEAILAAAEEYFEDGQGVHEALFRDRLAASIKYDQHFFSAPDIGLRDRVDLRRLSMLNHTPTLETV